MRTPIGCGRHLQTRLAPRMPSRRCWTCDSAKSVRLSTRTTRSGQEIGRRRRDAWCTGQCCQPQEWKKAKKAGAIQSTGKLCPSPKPYSKEQDSKDVTIIPQEKWTPGMKAIAEYAVFLGRELMDVAVKVTFVNTTNNFVACYAAGGDLHFNLFRLGYAWFEKGVTEEVDTLILHEYGHQFSGDHLSEEYHDALCLLGARLKKLSLEKPEEMRRFQLPSV